MRRKYNKSVKKCRKCPYSRQFGHCGNLNKCSHCAYCFHGIQAWMFNKVDKKLGTDLFLEFLVYLNHKGKI